ncbi:accessory gene regulator B family protein [Clostridium sp. Marseille-P2415]|uniref:accessory gene regulator B family protein n=1 Tax=Clostridium sp. Marseille-P2415 TaxID=1805471 RepID=UPI00098871E8|nr:accessory gene regulator B family protein [Clostridium sp. Marseille-P2415]
MIYYIADELSLCLVVNKIIPIEKRKYYTYGIELILNDLLIFIMVISLALITNTIAISILFTFSFCLLRTYTGGYHSKSYARCCVTAMVNYLSLLVFNSVLEEFRLYAGVIMMILSVPVVWIFSPIKHDNHPFNEREKEKYKKVSRILIIIISVFFIISIVSLFDKIVFVLAWSVFATSLLMLLAIILNKKEEISNEKTVLRDFSRYGSDGNQTGK